MEKTLSEFRYWKVGARFEANQVNNQVCRPEFLALYQMEITSTFDWYLIIDHQLIDFSQDSEMYSSR